MASSSGDQYKLHIGGNVSGPVVVGNENRVEHHTETHHPGPDSQDAAGPTQKNIAKDNATLYAVQKGEIHIHHDAAPQPPQG